MAKRDPEKTARRKRIDEMSEYLEKLRPQVLRATKTSSVFSLHGVIGGKHADYIDIKNEVIYSPQQFVGLWLEGYIEYIETRAAPWSKHRNIAKWLKKHQVFGDYLFVFLERTFLREYDALSKKRPRLEDAVLWIGQNNASYGLLVTPRFRGGQWENDKSEIRRFREDYWTIGHVLTTGLVVPNKKLVQRFASVDDYLTFFRGTLVRLSGSKHEDAIAKRYCKFVKAAPDPRKVPLLLPTFRYGGIAGKHKYRLDFLIIDPFELNKFGFELSPWSSHGYLSKTRGLTQKQINKMARDNFQREMAKHRSFFQRHGIFVRIYTDDCLADPDAIFADIEVCLNPKQRAQQLKLHIINNYRSLLP